jgi:hypothetical protein
MVSWEVAAFLMAALVLTALIARSMQQRWERLTEWVSLVRQIPIEAEDRNDISRRLWGRQLRWCDASASQDADRFHPVLVGPLRRTISLTEGDRRLTLFSTRSGLHDEGDPVVALVEVARTREASVMVLGDSASVFEGGISIGTSPDCDVRLDASRIEPFEIRVSPMGHHYRIDAAHGHDLPFVQRYATGNRFGLSGSPFSLDLGPFKVTIRIARPPKELMLDKSPLS